jgi:hypothetical protein
VYSACVLSVGHSEVVAITVVEHLACLLLLIKPYQ